MLSIYVASFIIAYSQLYGEVSKFHHPAHAVKKIISLCFVICNKCLCHTDFLQSFEQFYQWQQIFNSLFHHKYYIFFLELYYSILLILNVFTIDRNKLTINFSIDFFHMDKMSHSTPLNIGFGIIIASWTHTASTNTENWCIVPCHADQGIAW